MKLIPKDKHLKLLPTIFLSFCYREGITMEQFCAIMYVHGEKHAYRGEAWYHQKNSMLTKRRTSSLIRLGILESQKVNRAPILRLTPEWNSKINALYAEVDKISRIEDTREYTSIMQKMKYEINNKSTLLSTLLRRRQSTDEE